MERSPRGAEQRTLISEELLVGASWLQTIRPRSVPRLSSLLSVEFDRVENGRASVPSARGQRAVIRRRASPAAVDGPDRRASPWALVEGPSAPARRAWPRRR